MGCVAVYKVDGASSVFGRSGPRVSMFDVMWVGVNQSRMIEINLSISVWA